MPAEPEADPKSEELSAMLREIRERVRARYPEAGANAEPLPDLLPILHARDAVQAKVAAIGTVNPRRPGALNSAIQAVKRLVSRALDWHVREQVEFNRGVVAALEAILEALNENNRALAAMRQVPRDMASHWSEWRVAWEQRLAATENELLRTIAELRAAFDFRAAQVSEQIQRRLWADLEKVRIEYERMIHSELRLIRQRAAICACESQPSAPDRAAVAAPAIDWLRFAQRFRGSEEDIRERQRFYLPYFQGCRSVLDLGCGRGEFLELMREAGIPARGFERNEEMAALVRTKGLEVDVADLPAGLRPLADGSADGIFCAHVVEHLAPELVPELIYEAARVLQPGGVLAVETPNAGSLAIFATHFYLDPTHVRPVPPALLTFYAEEAGFGGAEVHRLSPAEAETPGLQSVPQELREAFFGALDYALIAHKL